MSNRFSKVVLLPLLLAVSASTAVNGWLHSCQAAPAAKPQRQGGSLPTAVINGYLSRLRNRTIPNWNLPDGKHNVVIRFTVQPDGQIVDQQVTSSPNSPAAEQAAQEAFAKAQPLEALPSGLAGAKIKLVFDSSADPHGDTSSNLGTHFDVIPPAKPAAPPAAPASQGSGQ